MNVSPHNIEKALAILSEIHEECIIKETINVNEILFLIGKVAGLLES